ncbi:MAG: glutamate formimidoyltransferase [Bacteroidota bacterium]|jgi:glutamate formiminotransferase/formiminotetrahydrofolate cyclodeaminase
MRIIECIPNISEGRDMAKINAIAGVVETVKGVMLLDVDPGASTNRTVITFAGAPELVAEAAFLLVKKASELIDMSQHKGEHPRQGATDVCPFVPISGVSMEECVEIARSVGERIGRELGIPGYFYEAAAKTEVRRNLANCRKGEYEAIEKITTADWKPDFGPSEVTDQVRKSGITTIGARNFLVAYNVNLNTTSTRRANAIAFDIREAGRTLREGDPLTGKPILDANGEPQRIPGTLKSVKGIGWYIEEYGIAQLSLNLTDISVTPVHVAFEEAVNKSAERGIRVTGSELVGLIPLQAMLDAADYFLTKQERSLGISESEKIKIAVKSLGLDDLAPFRSEEKIIEYVLAKKMGSNDRLIQMTAKALAEETSSESPAPGGGSVSAYVGALGVSLGVMVANLSAHKRGWDDRWNEFSQVAERGMRIQKELLRLVDEDTAAFNRIMEAFGLPKGTEEEKVARANAIEDASKYAMEIPLRTAEVALEGMNICIEMVKSGNPNSITDAGVGAMCIRTAALGAIMNVKINASGIKDKGFTERLLERSSWIESEVEKREMEVRNLVKLEIEK